MSKKWIGLVVMFYLTNFSSTAAQAQSCRYAQVMCSDGECIDWNLFCDGTKNCKDGSDENSSICNQTESKNRISCTTTAKQIIPENGCIVSENANIFTISTDSEHILPSGTYVDEFTVVNYYCYPEHLLEGVSTNFCVKRNWTLPEPVCKRYCTDAHLRDATFKANCEYNRESVPCEGHLKAGTIARITCQEGYVKPYNRNVSDVLRCDESGEWDYSPFRCNSFCGIENTDGTTFTLDKERSEMNIVPWHADIFLGQTNGYENICGGTIISAKIVVSAAHCIKSNYDFITVGVGKVYRNITDQEPFHPQYLNVSEIHHWYGEGLADATDIILLVLADSIKFTSKVRPICLEWLDYEEKYVASGIVGRLPTWGRNLTGLQMVELPTVSYDDCKRAVEPQFRDALSGDKFCIGYANGEMPREGHGGSGFVVPKYINGIKTYFLMGVVSNALVNGRQYPSNYTALTNIQFYQNMIMHYEFKLKLK